MMKRRLILEPARGSKNDKTVKRREVLEERNTIRELLKAAVSLNDPLSEFPALRNYCAHGLSVYLESGRGDKLSAPVKQYIRNLLRLNMATTFGRDWPIEEKVKHREMVSPEARYIFVQERRNGSGHERSPDRGTERKDSMVGFVHYRFVQEEDVPVLYIYEIQLEPGAQGKGLGKFLMQLIEEVARKNRMGAMMLTVQKSNDIAMNFYIKKLKFRVSRISPSKADPHNGTEKSYEILIKMVDPEAKSGVASYPRKEGSTAAD